MPLTPLLVFLAFALVIGCGGAGGGSTGGASGSSGLTNGGASSGTGSGGTSTGGTTGGTSTGSTTGGTSTGGTTGGTTGGSSGGQADLGPNADLKGRLVFPADNPWNTPIDAEPLDPNSDNLIASIGVDDAFHPDFGANWDGGPFGIPYVVVSGSQAKLPVEFDYADESDVGPYPIPANPPIEGGAGSSGDRHILIVDRDNWKLYELFAAYPPGVNGPTWSAGSGAIWDMTSNALRPAGWTSADAAGLPILPGLVRYDEVVLRGEIKHALRFTVQRTRRAYVHPARHWASSNPDPNLPPMGMRVRLKAGFDITGYPPSAQVILRALKKYGMFVADNGSDWYLSGAPDARWSDDELNSLKQLRGHDFEVVRMGAITPG